MGELPHITTMRVSKEAARLFRAAVGLVHEDAYGRLAEETDAAIRRGTVWILQESFPDTWEEKLAAIKLLNPPRAQDEPAEPEPSPVDLAPMTEDPTA